MFKWQGYLNSDYQTNVDNGAMNEGQDLYIGKYNNLEIPFQSGFPHSRILDNDIITIRQLNILLILSI